MDTHPSSFVVVTQHVVSLLEDGNNAPTCREIFSPLGRGAPANEDRAGFLREVRRRLRKDYGLNSCTVSEFFYQEQRASDGNLIRKSFRDKPPVKGEESEAYKCLALGGVYTLAGLYVPKEDHDLVLLASLIKLNWQATIMNGVAFQDASLGIENGFLHKGKTIKVLKSTTSEAIAEKATPLWEKLLGATAELKKLMEEAKEKDE